MRCHLSEANRQAKMAMYASRRTRMSRNVSKLTQMGLKTSTKNLRKLEQIREKLKTNHAKRDIYRELLLRDVVKQFGLHSAFQSGKAHTKNLNVFRIRCRSGSCAPFCGRYRGRRLPAPLAIVRSVEHPRTLLAPLVHDDLFLTSI